MGIGALLGRFLETLPASAIASYGFSLWLSKRKERMDSLTAISDLRTDLEGELMVYWTADARNADVEMSIVRLNNKFNSKVRRYVKKYGVPRGKLLETFGPQLTRFNVQLTAEPFGTRWKKSPQIVASTQQRLDDLLNYIE